MTSRVLKGSPTGKRVNEPDDGRQALGRARRSNKVARRAAGGGPRARDVSVAQPPRAPPPNPEPDEI